jgi:hypothetical protein
LIEGLPPDLAVIDQTSLLEDGQMLGNGRPADAELGRHLMEWQLIDIGKDTEQLAASWISHRAVHVSHETHSSPSAMAPGPVRTGPESDTLWCRNRRYDTKWCPVKQPEMQLPRHRYVRRDDRAIATDVMEGG